MLLDQEHQIISTSLFTNEQLVTNSRYDPASECQYCKLQKKCIALDIELGSNSNNHQINHHSSLVKQDEHLYFKGDPVKSIYIVKSGAFKSYLINHNGNEQIVDFHLPGDILGFEDILVQQFESSVVALERSSICTLQVSQLKYLINRLVPDWLTTVLMDTLKQQQRHILILGKKDAKSRMATFLLNISKELELLGFSKKNLILNMTRQDIGNYLGLASETISRILTNLKNEGVLAIDKREIKIIDFDCLCELADKDITYNLPKTEPKMIHK